MNSLLANILVALVIIALIALALFAMFHHKKQKGSCCGSNRSCNSCKTTCNNKHHASCIGCPYRGECEKQH